MERIERRLTVLHEALKTFETGIAFFYEYEKILKNHPSQKNEDLYTSMRDAMIKRFTYSTDLFLKTLHAHLEDREKREVLSNSPRGIIRETVTAKIISEDEGMQCMEMVESRNKTSHIYHVEMAEAIARQVPLFYTLIQTILKQIQK